MLNFKLIDIEWKTVCDKDLNLDSITSWNNLILVSSKNNHSILCFNKNTGKLVQTIGSKGFDHDKFNRPNGLKVINDYLFIVERDNKRCQIINMKTKEAISYFGFKNLKKPYGIDGLFYKDQYIIFITDEKKEIVFKFNIIIRDDEIKKISSDTFLELSGAKLESILLDETNNRILIADEKMKKIRIFSLSGILIKNIENIFEGDPEGMVRTDDSYIFTDQIKEGTYFHVFDIKNMEYKHTLYNDLVKNSDGIHYLENDIYTIDDNCSLVKMSLNIKNNNGMSKILLIGGLVLAAVQKFI